MKYRIKTRNWHGKVWVYKALAFMRQFGVCVPFEEDYDVKAYYETFNPMKAYAIWLYFMALKPFSGGWTYIVRPGREISGCTYKSIY